MPRQIDTDKAYKVLTKYYHHKTDVQHDALKEALGKVPTVDAVEVVRCKDCKYADEDGLCGNVVWYNKEDDFCSMGERREDADK